MSDCIKRLPPQIAISGLSVRYGDKTVFDNFDITFEAGKISVLLGPSGVGKTTLLNAVAGLIPYDGKVEKGEGNISYIFQKDRLIPSISVYKNLDLVLRAICKDKKERQKRIDEMLSLLEISHCAHKLPPTLSGGEAQRVAMARAYLYPADILLLDEPFKALDTSLKSRLTSQLLKLNSISPRTIVFVTHAIDECLLLADNFYVLDGSPAEVLYSGGIEATSRKLSDPALAEVRETLLEKLSL